jgi:hypothetical protein
LLGVLAHLVGDQDLSADRLSHHPCRGVHSLPVQVSIVLGDPPCVDSDADLDRALGFSRVVLEQCSLDGGGRPHRRHSGRKGNEKPVAQGLAHLATERCDLLVHHR